MTRTTNITAHHCQAIRLVALVLALLVAMGSLTSHAAMDSHQADCGFTSSVQLFDSEATAADDTRCSACSMLPHSGVLVIAEPPFPAFAPEPAMVSHRPPPPRRPPKT